MALRTLRIASPIAVWLGQTDKQRWVWVVQRPRLQLHCCRLQCRDGCTLAAATVHSPVTDSRPVVAAFAGPCTSCRLLNSSLRRLFVHPMQSFSFQCHWLTLVPSSRCRMQGDQGRCELWPGWGSLCYCCAAATANRASRLTFSTSHLGSPSPNFAIDAGMGRRRCEEL